MQSVQRMLEDINPDMCEVSIELNQLFYKYRIRTYERDPEMHKDIILLLKALEEIPAVEFEFPTITEYHKQKRMTKYRRIPIFPILFYYNTKSDIYLIVSHNTEKEEDSFFLTKCPKRQLYILPSMYNKLNNERIHWCSLAQCVRTILISIYPNL